MIRLGILVVTFGSFVVCMNGQEVGVEMAHFRLNDSAVYFRAGTDLNHGLEWFGDAKTFAGVSIDGPILYGYAGGALGSRFTEEKIALRWDANGNVGIGTITPIARLTVESLGNLPLLDLLNSNGMIRLQDQTTAYLDIGKSAVAPFTAWLQSGFITDADPLSLQPLGGHLGIGTTDPTTTLDVDGQIRMRTGAASGHVPMSDADGVMTWTDPGLLGVPDPNLPVPIRYQGTILYVHPSDNGTNVSWGDESIATAAVSLTDGAVNTAAIVAMDGLTTAAGICDTLTAFGFNDWYLPAQYELDAIYKQSYLMIGLELNADWKYWSSTEIDMSNAWAHRLDYGGPDEDGKLEANHNVRCVRRE
jgi:hypothetical protein